MPKKCRRPSTAISPISSFLSVSFIFLLITMVVLSGCSVEQQTKLAHVKGTLAWMRGDWNDAVLYFYEAESLATELPDTERLHPENYRIFPKPPRIFYGHTDFISRGLLHFIQRIMRKRRHCSENPWSCPVAIWQLRLIMS